MSKAPACILVIGASAGGVNALKQLVPQIETNLNMAVFIVLHLARNIGIGWLQRNLQRLTMYIAKSR